MPCGALARGIRQAAPHTGMPFLDAINNNPCGLKIVTTIGGVDVSAQNLCLWHIGLKRGLASMPAPIVQAP